MTKRIHWYILCDIGKLFAISLTAFTAVIMLGVIGKELHSQGLGPRSVLDMLPYALPMSLPYAIPPTLLFAICSVYGRISADNEIIATMAAGIRPMAIIKPALLLAFFISLIAVWINDIAVPWGKPGINRVVMHSIEEVVYSVLSNNGSYEAQGFSIHVHGVGEDGRELISPTISLRNKSGTTSTTVTAKSGRLRMDPVHEVLEIHLEDQEVDTEGFVGTFPGHKRYEIPLDRATKKGTSSGHPTEFQMHEISREILAQREQINQSKDFLAVHAGMALASGQSIWLDDATTHSFLGSIILGSDRLVRLHVEPWRRWAFGFSCFFFVWLGIPLSIYARTADHWTSFGVCFLPILLLYFPFFGMALEQSKGGGWPPISIWLANAILLFVGWFWLRKIHHS
ncbi:MAG: LptF/LptG family permease [Planctomycetales bacterium]|nr:LptF/LptG family permease [Planctomycetales bacterium]